MKLAIIGYGKMGKAIEKIAVKKGHSVILKLNSTDELDEIDLAAADVALEFTTPETAFQNVMKCIDIHVPVVCGTTGWNKQLPIAEDHSKKNGGSFFYSSNFSIGVNIFFQVNTLLARLMNLQEQYDDVLIHETHHKEKLDMPSGTAIVLANQILGEVTRFKHWAGYNTNENVNLSGESEGELAVFSSRENDIPGTHIVKYFSDVDEIEIIHKAFSRDGFALGAVAAAEWLHGKQGNFNMKDLLKL